MKKSHLLIFIVSIFLSGCAGSPASIMTASPGQLRSMETLDLINAWSVTGSENARMELNRRQVFSAQEWELIKRHQVAIGMSKAALYASQGFPNGGRTITEAGVTLKGFFYRTQTVYLINDKVVRIERFR